MDFKFFLSLSICIAVPALVGGVLRAHRVLPAVFIQLLVGIALTQTGAVAFMQQLGMNLTEGSLANALSGLGWLGVSLLIAILAGDASPTVKREGSHFVPISILGFSITFSCGMMFGLQLAEYHPELMGPRANALGFAVGIGVAMAVSALPVLMSILRELDLFETRIGRLAANCACLDDLWLWLGLSVALTVSNATGSLLQMLSFTIVYLLVMATIVPVLIRRLLALLGQHHHIDPLIVALGTVFLSSAATDAIGLHTIFGAYVAGAIMPREAWGHRKAAVEQISRSVLLPLFFVFTGMALQLNLQGFAVWWLILAALGIGIGTKLVAVTCTARFLGLPWLDAISLGTLMQCKGMMELVALNILLSAQLIGRSVFTALVIMAVVSTFAVIPIFQVLLGRRMAMTQDSGAL